MEGGPRRFEVEARTIAVRRVPARRIAALLSLVVLGSVAPVIPPAHDASGDPPRIVRTSLPVPDGPVVAPHRFALVAMTWPSQLPAPPSVRVRTRAGGRWTGWQRLETDADEEGPDRRGPIAGTFPLWVGHSDAIDVSVRASRATLGAGRIELIDPGREPRRGASRAFAAVGTPGFISRAQWGADESIRGGEPSYARDLRATFVHHTVTGNGYAAADGPRIVRSIYAYHVLSRGWSDIGYNALVDAYGRAYEGRAGGLDRPVIGAHAQGFNTGSAGVAVIGTHSDGPPSAAARRAVADVLAWKLDLHHVDPSGGTTMTSGGGPKYGAGTPVALRRINGHRDVGTTSCPGGSLYAALPGIRADVANPARGLRIYDPGASRAELTPNGDGVADWAQVGARFSEHADWTVTIRSPEGSVVHEAGGSSGHAIVDWNGRTPDGRPVAHGTYVARIEAHNHRGTARPADVALLVRAWPTGAVLTGPGRDEAWLLENEHLRRLAGPRALESRMPWSETISVAESTLALYPKGPATGFREGALVRVAGGTWLISGGQRRAVSPEAFEAAGFRPESVIEAADAELQAHAISEPLGSLPVRPEGVALSGLLLPDAWKLGGAARSLVSEAVRRSHGIRDVDLVGPADAEIAASGGLSPLGFRDGSLVRGTSSPAVYVISQSQRRPISSALRFESLGYRWSSVLDVTDAEVALHPLGPAI